MERDIIDKAIFEDKALLQLYIYLRSQAKYTPVEKIIDSKKIILQPGQLTLGSRQVAAALGYSPATAYRHLKKLEKLGEITIKPFKSCSLISLTFWPTEKPKSEAPSKSSGASDTAEKSHSDEMIMKRKRNANETQMKTPIEGYKDINNDLEQMGIKELLDEAVRVYRESSPYSVKQFGVGGVSRARDCFEAALIKDKLPPDKLMQAILDNPEAPPWEITKKAGCAPQSINGMPIVGRPEWLT